jgi:hypothetical protein
MDLAFKDIKRSFCEVDIVLLARYSAGIVDALLMADRNQEIQILAGLLLCDGRCGDKV